MQLVNELWTPRRRERVECAPPPIGFTLGAGGRAIKKRGASFDPSTLALTGWWRSNYSGSPWNDDSGNTRTLEQSNAGFRPVTGAPVNGYVPALFDASDDYMNTVAVANNVFMSSTASSGWFLINSLGVPASVGVYQDGNLLTDSVNAETTFGHVDVSGTPKFIIALYAGAYIRLEVAMGTGAWHIAQWKHDGVNMFARVDSGNWSSTACGTLSFLTPSAFTMSVSYSAALKMNGSVIDVGITNTVISDANFDNLVREYANGRYGLSL